jgi:hypothetical protein
VKDKQMIVNKPWELGDKTDGAFSVQEPVERKIPDFCIADYAVVARPFAIHRINRGIWPTWRSSQLATNTSEVTLARLGVMIRALAEDN